MEEGLLAHVKVGSLGQDVGSRRRGRRVQLPVHIQLQLNHPPSLRNESNAHSKPFGQCALLQCFPTC